MGKHVDIVVTDAEGSMRRRVVRLEATPRGVVAKVDDPRYAPLAQFTVLENDSGPDGVVVSAEREPERYLELLAAELVEGHVTATLPHDDGCPFAGWEELPADDRGSVTPTDTP